MTADDAQHAPHNAMTDPDEILRFHDRCTDLMRELLGALAAAPDRARPFPEIEAALGWPRRRIASVLGGVWRLRTTEFGGRRPYRFLDDRQSDSGRWELWMDSVQAAAVRTAGREGPSASRSPQLGGEHLRDRLRADLRTALKTRDRTLVAVLRTTLAALDNAEAVQAGPAPATSSTHVAGASAGAGSSDVARRALSEDEVRAIVRREAADRREAAAEYERRGRVDQAHALREDASLLDSYVEAGIIV